MQSSSVGQYPNVFAKEQLSHSLPGAETRIAAVDAARGCAMLMVCLSHIRHHFVASAPALEWALAVVTRIATPTFLLLSGFVVFPCVRDWPRLAHVFRRSGLDLSPASPRVGL
jgi:uncharacterized membrane protein